MRVALETEQGLLCSLRWYERLPVVRGWVDWVVLATCGGANIRLVCDGDPRFDSQ